MRFFLSPVYKKKKKFHKHKVIGSELKPHLLELTKGIAGLKAIENGRLTPKQLEATRRVLSKALHRTSKIIFHVHPELAVTKKPKEVRMGKGKGAVKLWVVNVRRGKIILEITNATLDVAKECLLSAATKLPIQTQLILQDPETISL